MISYEGGSILMTKGDALIIAGALIVFLIWLTRDKECKKEDLKDTQK
jgi:hypothetical protein